MKVLQRPLNLIIKLLLLLPMLFACSLLACSGQGFQNMALEDMDAHNLESPSPNRGAPTIAEVGPDTEGPQEIVCSKRDPDCSGGFLVLGGKESTPTPEEPEDHPASASHLAYGDSFAAAPTQEDDRVGEITPEDGNSPEESENSDYEEEYEEEAAW